jgi:ERCC4-related helicase
VTSKPAAKVVMVVPTLALCGQQATALSQYCGCPVGDFNGNNPLPADKWQHTLEQHSMMVFTAQTFVNVLEQLPEALSQVDLLVLDEVHHARGDSPYTKIMDIRSKLASDGAQVRVQLLHALYAAGRAHTCMCCCCQCNGWPLCHKLHAAHKQPWPLATFM